MPRSSKVDAVEKFRFSVFIINTGFSFEQIVSNFSTFLRGGFSEVTMPQQSTTAIEYRENLDSAHVSVGPGLTRYEPVTLKRGVTTSSDFFRWASAIHNSSDVVATSIQRIKGGTSEKPPSEILDFRRDVLIVIYGRGGALNTGAAGKIPGVNKAANVAGAAGLSLVGLGDVTKAILLRDAWAQSFKPGDVLSAEDDQSKLIEELELRYESFEEITLEALLSKQTTAGGIAGGLGSTILKGGRVF